MAWRPALAVLYAELGMTEQARAEVARVCETGLAQIRTTSFAWVLSYLVRVLAVGDAEHAYRLRAMRPHAGRNVLLGGLVACYGVVDRYLGMCARPAGVGTKPRDLTEALRRNSAMGSPTWSAHRHADARMLLARRGRGDAEHAATLHATGHIAHDHALTALLAHIASSPPRPPPSPRCRTGSPPANSPSSR